MTISLLLLTCLLLSPWAVQFFRYVTTRPEAIPTPTWMVTSAILFLFLGPLISGVVFGEDFAGHDRAASWIAFTSVCYWVTFTAVYRLLSGRHRTVEPDGPAGLRSPLGNLRLAVLSTTTFGAFAVFVPLALIKLFFVQVWGLGVSGGGLAMMQLPYYLVIVLLLTQFGTTPFTAVFTAKLFSRTSVLTKLFCIPALATNLGFALVAGRRPMLLFFGLAAVGLIWTGRRRNVVAIVGLGLAVWFLLAVFSPVFLRARSIWRDRNGPDVLTAFKMAIEEGGTEGKSERLQKESEANVKARINTYAFWLAFYDNYMSKPLGGLLLAQAILMNIPRMFIGLSKYSLGATEEYLFGTDDISNNVCLESFIDLGPGGPFVYGAIFATMFFTVDWLLAWIATRNRYLAILVAGSLLEPLVSPESDLMGYFSMLRNVLTFCALTVPISVIIGRLPVNGERRDAPVRPNWPGLPRPVSPSLR